MSKYARVERERRFLVRALPSEADVVRVRHIEDLYIDGTALRLRELTEPGHSAIFKLTQKIPDPGEGAQQGWVTNLYLAPQEFRLLAQLPGQRIRKKRLSVPPFGVDLFEGELQGLCLAEAEFDSAADAEALALPPFLGPEVSVDERFTGGRLSRASRDEWRLWLREYEIHFSAGS